MSSNKYTKKSLYDWCIENHREDILSRWDYELNIYSPKEVNKATHAKYFLKCPKGLHKSVAYDLCSMQYQENMCYPCLECRSFGQWCLDNSRKDLLDRWDYSQNSINPFNVFKHYRSFYYFKCNQNLEHKSTKHYIERIKENSVLACENCNSFAQWGINNICQDFLQKYWNYELNKNIDPWIITKRSNKMVYINCIVNPYHGSYKISCDTFTQGVRCGYCAKIKIHPDDSFANYHISHTDVDFISKYWGLKNEKSPYEYAPFSAKMVWIKCQKVDYHGEYQIACSSFSEGRRCGYCHNMQVHPLDSLGTKYPVSLEFWSTKNKTSPFDYFPGSEAIVYWKCESSCHDDYIRSPAESVRYEFRCPACSQIRGNSFLQEKVCNYISNNYSCTLSHEFACSLTPINPKTKFRLPFDNLIEDLKLVIEVHGEQHYNIDHFHTLQAKHNGTTPEFELHKQQLHDRYKKFVAYCRGYFYLEVPYTSEQDESYKKLIYDKITEILTTKPKSV